MSFHYPHTVSIYRPDPQKFVGPQGYGGQKRCKEELRFKDVPAGIQQKGATGAGVVRLPADSNKALWEILFILPKDAVQNNDIIVDELGRRFQVDQAYWTPMNYQNRCTQLEA